MTYCPNIWDEVFIDERGCIYSCCHNKPDIIGNIYDDNLNDIINSSSIIAWREKSLNNKLGCYDKCTLVRKTVSVHRPITVQRLQRVKVKFGEACNINCIMCRQNSKDSTVLNYRSLVNSLTNCVFDKAVIQGGEPLFIEPAKLFFDYCAKKKIKVSFMTNGLLIDNIWAKKIVQHSETISFSINAATKITHERINKGSDFNRVLGNIQKINEYRRRTKSGLIIKGHMTIVRQNINEIPLFIEKFSELGFDRIDFGFDRSIKLLLGIVPSRLKKKIQDSYASAENKDRIDTLRLEILKLI